MGTDNISYSEMTVFVAMDHFHDRSVRMEINLHNGIPGVLMLHADIRRMQESGFSVIAIKDRIRHTIDESDAILVIAGDYSNEPEQSTEPIGVTNWLHWCLEYAALVNKPAIGFKVKKSSPIPKPLRGKGIDWKILTLRTFVFGLNRLQTEFQQSAEATIQLRKQSAANPPGSPTAMLKYSAKRLGIAR